MEPRSQVVRGEDTGRSRLVCKTEDGTGRDGTGLEANRTTSETQKEEHDNWCVEEDGYFGGRDPATFRTSRKAQINLTVEEVLRKILRRSPLTKERNLKVVLLRMENNSRMRYSPSGTLRNGEIYECQWDTPCTKRIWVTAYSQSKFLRTLGS